MSYKLFWVWVEHKVSSKRKGKDSIVVSHVVEYKVENKHHKMQIPIFFEYGLSLRSLCTGYKVFVWVYYGWGTVLTGAWVNLCSLSFHTVFQKLMHTDLYLNTLIPTQHLKLTNTLIEKAQNEWKLQLETTPELSVLWEYAL